MFKELLIGVEALGSIVSPTPVKPIPIEVKIENFENAPKIRQKRSDGGYVIQKPERKESLVAIHNKEHYDKPYFYEINENSNIKPNKKIEEYNSSIQWNIKEVGNNLFKIYQENKGVGLYLFPKIKGKKILKKNGTIYSYPVFNEEIEIDFPKMNWQTHQYYSNKSILSGIYSVNLKRIFELQKNMGKKFIITKIFFYPKLNIPNIGYSNTDIKISNVYLNGNKIDDQKIERSLFYYKSENDFSKNINDLEWKKALEEAYKYHILPNSKKNTQIDDSEMLKNYVKLGFEIIYNVISSHPVIAPAMTKVSIVRAVTELLYQIVSEKRNKITSVLSTTKTKILNGDILNKFSIDLKKPVSVNLDTKLELEIFDIILESESTDESQYPEKIKLNIDNFDVELEGSWVDNNFSSLESEMIRYEKTTINGDIESTINTLTGERIDNEEEKEHWPNFYVSTSDYLNPYSDAFDEFNLYSYQGIMREVEKQYESKNVNNSINSLSHNEQMGLHAKK